MSLFIALFVSLDINECSDTSLCPGANAECKNLEPSYDCVCTMGFEPVMGETPLRCTGMQQLPQQR